MRFLTLEQILFLHYSIIESTGGCHGLRDLTLLRSAVARPQAGFGEIEFYPDIFDKAAVITHSIIKNHPFLDGNKRTGIAAGIILLEINNIKITVSQEELVSFTLQIAEGKIDWQGISGWFRDHLG